MYQGLLHTHSGLRYIVILLLITVIIKSLIGSTKKIPFTSVDNKISLWLLIVTHIQFVLGVWLYFVSPLIQFNSDTMKEAPLRYWAVEHFAGMLIAVVLITIARSTSKRMTNDVAKHKRLFTLNTAALFIIVAVILQSGRKVFLFF